MTVIDIVFEKCKQIIEKDYKNDMSNPRVMISEMYEKGYLLTLICSENEEHFEFIQSEFIDLDTDLEQIIEVLYNRTM